MIPNNMVDAINSMARALDELASRSRPYQETEAYIDGKLCYYEGAAYCNTEDKLWRLGYMEASKGIRDV